MAERIQSLSLRLNARPACVILAFCLTTGCVASKPADPLAEANGNFDAGDYARALMDYRIALSHPLSEVETETAKFRVGAAYFQMKAYADAQESLGKYVEEYPGGRYVEKAQRILALIHDQWEERAAERTEEYRELLGKINETEKEVEASPGDAALHYELADLYWRAGQWDKSTEQYAAAMRISPAYETDPLVVARVEVDESGVVHPKKPLVSSDIYGNEGPLQIEEARSKIVSELSYKGESFFVLVGGYVVNQSVRAYSPVDVQVSLLDFNNAVINSRVVRVGRVGGGERRRFDAQIYVFGSSTNVYRFECRLIYPR